MAHAEQISILRRRRGVFIGRMTRTRRHLDDYEENGWVDEDYLIACRESFEENWMKLIAVQDELKILDGKESESLVPVSDEYHQLQSRISGLLKRSHTSTQSELPQCGSVNEPEPTLIKLSEKQLHHLYQIALATSAILKESSNTSNPF